MVSPRKRSLVVRQMRSGPKTLHDSPEDWVSGSNFQFKESPVISKRVLEGRRNTSVFRMSPRQNSPKKRRQSMILKRLDLPSSSVFISPASNRRRTRRQSTAVMASTVTLAGISEMNNSKVPKQVPSKAIKSSQVQVKKLPKKDSPKKIETRKKPKVEVLVSLSPLVFYNGPEKKGKEVSPEKKGKSLSQYHSPRSSSAKRKADHEATNKVDPLAKKFKRGSSEEVSKVTKINSPGSKEVSPSVGKRKLRSEIPLKADTSIKSKRVEAKKVSLPKSPSSLTVKLKCSEEKEKYQNLVKSPKGGKVSAKKSPISLRTLVSPKVNAKKSPVSLKSSASTKISSPVVKNKASPKKKPVDTSEKKEVSSDSTKSVKLSKVKITESLECSPKELTPLKLRKTVLLSKKTELSQKNKTSPKLEKDRVKSKDSSQPSGKFDKIEKAKSPKSSRKVALPSPKSSVQEAKGRKDEKVSSSSSRCKGSSNEKVSPKSQQSKTGSPTPKQEKHTLRKSQQTKSGEKLVSLKKTPLPSPNHKKISSIDKENKSSKGKTISGDTPNKKVVTIKTPLSLQRIDSPLGGTVRLTRSSRRVTLAGRSPRSCSFKKTPKPKQKSPMKGNNADIGASPIFSARTQLNLMRCRSPLRSSVRGGPVAKVKPFTPKPDSPPSHVLRKTLKKNVAHKMHATTKVEIHQLMNGEISKPVRLVSGEKIVTESVSVTQAQVSSLNIAVTPRKALSGDHVDGVDKTIVHAATPASASNLPPTPTSSRKQSEPLRSIIANTSSKVASQRSLIATPRSSTPIKDNDCIKPLSVDTLIDDETNFTDGTETNFTDDKETSVTDDKETSFTDDKETSFTDDKETSFTDDQETSFTDDKETSFTDDKETSFIDDKETNFTDDSIYTDQSEDEESVMEDNKNVIPEKPKRSYCSIM